VILAMSRYRRGFHAAHISLAAAAVGDAGRVEKWLCRNCSVPVVREKSKKKIQIKI